MQQVLEPIALIKQKEREEKAINSWYLSGFGTPLIGRYMQRLGVATDLPPDKRLQRVFDVGNIFEDWVVGILKQNPNITVETQERVEDKALGVSGRLDLLITDKATGERSIKELKSKQSKSFHYMVKKGQGASLHNKLQLWGYLFLKKITKGSLVYISKDDLCMVEYPIFLDDNELRTQWLNELTILNYCWAKQLCPPLPEKDSWWWKYMPYSEAFIRAYVAANPCITDEEIKNLKNINTLTN